MVVPGHLHRRDDSGLAERPARLVGRVHQNGYVVGGTDRRRRDERELVAQLAGVLDDADDRPSATAERELRADPKLEAFRDSIGDRNLIRPRRVAATAERE